MRDRFFASVFVAVIALFVAMNCGVPFWRLGQPGDASDIAVTSFLAVWFAIGAISHERGEPRS